MNESKYIGVWDMNEKIDKLINLKISGNYRTEKLINQ